MFKVIKKEGSARRGEFVTVHGTVQTPAFMNVATCGAIKGAVSALDLKNIKCQVQLCNTYHLHLRPGDEKVKQMGGLHKFTRWNGPILTDSGGFQVFSLAKLRNIKEEGVYFNSHIDGRKIFMGPEESMRIQSNLASTIAMAFDECVENPSPYEYTKNSVERTTRWHMTAPLPEKYKDMVIVDAENVEEVASQVDFCFCAVNMKKDEIRDLEDRYAKAECPIVSNNSAHRFTDDVPMVIPEINADHIKIIDAQRKRLGTKRGFVAVKSNCSLQSYVPAIHPLKAIGVDKVLACTYQAISGAGKTFKTWPEMVDNVIPYIGGEEEKSEQEPLKIWGKIEGDKIVKTDDISITSQCIRVPVSDGHTAAVFMSFKDGVKKPTVEEIIDIWSNYSGRAQELDLPSAPKHFLHYFTEPDRPQIKSERNLENGMAVSVGRLRPDTQYDYKFVCMSHNTLRGAAGGAVLLAELLCAEGYMD